MKLLGFFAILSVAFALKTTNSAYSESATCSECVLNGDKYCAKSVFNTWKVSEMDTYKGLCNQTSDTCVQDKITLSNYKSRTVALAACENLSDYCGTERDVVFNGVGEKWSPSLENIPQGNTCSYRIKARCGAPIFNQTGTINAADLEIAYIHYTSDSRVNIDNGYPVPASLIHDVTDYCTDSSTKSLCSTYAATRVARQKVEEDASHYYVTLDQILNGQNSYKESKADYENEVRRVDIINQWDDFLNFFGLQPQAEPYPEYIGAYSGPSFANTKSMGGYGEPTTGSYDMTRKGWLQYGVIYQDIDHEENPWSSNYSLDYNSDGCIDRYLILTLIPWNRQATKGTLTINVRSNILITDIDMKPPTAPPNAEGAWKLAIGAALSFSLLSLVA